MNRVRVCYDKEMDTIDIWFDEPPEEGYSREVSDGIILKYDLKGNVAGVEILFLSKQKNVQDLIPKEIRDDFKRAIEDFMDNVKAIA